MTESDAEQAGEPEAERSSLRFLSEEWLAERFRLAWTAPPALSDVTIKIQHIVEAGPDGDVRYFDDVVGGRLKASALGTLDDPDVTITNRWDDELAVLRGVVDPTDLLIEGRVSVDGDQQLLLLLLPALMSVTANDLVLQLAASTETRIAL